MNQECAVVLIIAPSGRLRDGLQAIVKAVPRVGQIDIADDGLEALSIIAECPPSMILLDADLPDGQAQMVVAYLKAHPVDIRYIVLANNGYPRVSADMVLNKTMPIAALGEAIDNLLCEYEQQP